MISLKDKISNIMAIVSMVIGIGYAVYEAWAKYIMENPDANISWPVLIGMLILAVTNYLTGKTANLKGSHD
jgi:hypothetical protein